MSNEPDPFEQPRISVWRRLLLLVGGLVVVIVVIGVARWSYDRTRAQSRLDTIVSDLDAHESPWRLEEIEDARPLIPDAANSARVVVLIDKLLPRDWPTPEFMERFEEVIPPDLLDPERRKLLADEMKSLAPALVEARKMADMPRGRHKLVYAAIPSGTPLNDQTGTRRAASLLQYDAWDRALDGDLHGALLAGRAGINAGRSLGDEPFVISQMIRGGCVAVALSGLERSLALGEARDADLAE